MKPILCIDFDGVVHSYSSGWKGDTIILDPPVPGAIEWLWRASGYFTVVIYSSRSKNPEAIIAMREWLRRNAELCFETTGHSMVSSSDAHYPIKFASEKPAAFLTIDDRAICFEGDWSALDPKELLNFKPWNKR